MTPFQQIYAFSIVFLAAPPSFCHTERDKRPEPAEVSVNIIVVVVLGRIFLCSYAVWIDIPPGFDRPKIADVYAGAVSRL
jgi:hypothetical protein